MEWVEQISHVRVLPMVRIFNRGALVSIDAITIKYEPSVLIIYKEVRTCKTTNYNNYQDGYNYIAELEAVVVASILT